MKNILLMTRGGIERDEIRFVIQGEKRQQVEKEVEKWLNNISLINQ